MMPMVAASLDPRSTLTVGLPLWPVDMVMNMLVAG
jgi:hypothetical protein